MSFGTLSPTTSAGTVILSTAGVINTNGTAVTVTSSGTNAVASQITYASKHDLSSLSVTTPLVQLSNNNGGTLIVQNFVISTYVRTSSSNEYKITASIGASLIFSSASTAGTYTGTATVQSLDISGNTQTETFTISVTLIKTISVSETVPLRFGTITTTGAGSAIVTIAPQTGNRTVTSGGTNITLDTADPGTAATFAITGQKNQSVTVSLPASTTLTGPGTTMTVNAFTMYPASNIKFDSNGNLTQKVGASLNINPSQMAGTYTGTYSISINY